VILSRVFGLSLGIFLAVSLLAYVCIDFRPVREQAIEALKKQRYFTILDLYKDERFLEEEDYGILSLALDGITKEINTKPSAESRIRSAESLRRRYRIDFVNKGSVDEPCIHLDDPYFPFLKKHAYLYHRSLMAKATSTCFCNPPEENTLLLSRILLEDPNQMIRETSETLRTLFDAKINKLEELELGFFREVMHFLAEKEESEFYGNLYRTTGNRINLRSGPGQENPVIGQLESGDELYCYDEMRLPREEEGGSWKKCFSVQLFRSGWVVSKYIQSLPPSQEIISRGRKRFSNLEFYTLIDFDSWNERIIPNHFHGNYIKTERVTRRGESGFRLYRPVDGRIELICRKFSGRKNYLELYYEIESSELPIPILELQIVQGGLVFPAFRISAQRNFVFLNGAKFMIDRPEVRETLSLKISSGSRANVRGTLIHKNKGVIENLDSYPIEERILISKAYSWEVCIPQALERSKDSALLFGFRIGREE